MRPLPEITDYHLHEGDCIRFMMDLEPACIDLAVFSPPFPQLFAYTSSHADIGNSEDFQGDAKLHLTYFYRQLARILKPGRVAMVHVTQIVRMRRTGGQGTYDFRGLNIRLAERAGLIYQYDWSCGKNPQAQAIRTKSRELQFAGLESDRSKSRGAMPDYLIKFMAPGENKVPINDKESVSRNQWIAWAEHHWRDIRENDTLNVKDGRGDDDTKHICALQKSVIDRLVRLFSAPGELVFSPFAGIGSEGYQSILRGRRFLGCELKKEYIDAARNNLNAAIKRRNSAQRSLFAEAGI